DRLRLQRRPALDAPARGHLGDPVQILGVEQEVVDDVDLAVADRHLEAPVAVAAVGPRDVDVRLRARVGLVVARALPVQAEARVRRRRAREALLVRRDLAGLDLERELLARAQARDRAARGAPQPPAAILDRDGYRGLVVRARADDLHRELVRSA